MTVLDSNLKALMNTTVSWESYSSSSLYGDASYAAAVSLTCFVEGQGVAGTGGAKAVRRKDDTVVDPNVTLYFDANDSNVASFSMKDRFTIMSLEGVEVLRSKPDSMEVLYGPQGEKWVTVVQL